MNEGIASPTERLSPNRSALHLIYWAQKSKEKVQRSALSRVWLAAHWWAPTKTAKLLQVTKSGSKWRTTFELCRVKNSNRTRSDLTLWATPSGIRLTATRSQCRRKWWSSWRRRRKAAQTWVRVLSTPRGTMRRMKARRWDLPPRKRSILVQ